MHTHLNFICFVDRDFGLAGYFDRLETDIDKNFLNLKEWYGWHFPELATLLTEPPLYAKAILALGIIRLLSFFLETI